MGALRRGLAVLVATLVVASAAAVPASGQERAWTAVGSQESFVVSYATPETDDGVLSLACRRATKELSVALVHEPQGAKTGMRVAMELVSDGGTVRLEAEGRRLLMDDVFVLEAKVPMTAALARVLTSGRVLKAKVQAGSQEIPLAGSEKAVTALIAACS